MSGPRTTTVRHLLDQADTVGMGALAQTMTPGLARAVLPDLDGGIKAVAELKQEISADLSGHDAIHVLACLAAQAFQRPLAYSELDDEPGANIEYIASILLERSTRDPIANAEQEHTRSRAIQRTLDRTRGIGARTIMDAEKRREEAASAVGALAAQVEVHDALIRWPGYAQQEEALLTRLSENPTVATQLRTEMGFDLANALRLQEATGELVVARFNAHGRNVAERADKLRGPAPTGRARTRTAVERELKAIANEHFSDALTDALLFDAPSLAERAGVSDAVASAFLKQFSCDFGDTKGTTVPTGRSIVRARPLIHAGDGRYLLTAVGNLLWSIRPAIEGALKEDPAVFARYEPVRSAYAERHAADALGRALRTPLLWSNVGYLEGGASYETDVLVRSGEVCFVVEVKAGHLGAKAKKGRKADLLRDLGAVVGEGASQAKRLSDLLRQGVQPEFFDRASGEALAIDLEGVERVEAVVVTLEDLGYLSGSTSLLKDAGILSDGEPPWIVSLYDLEVISRACRFASQFTLYVRRRRTLDRRVRVLDECDLWMLYLRETLDFSRVRGASLMINGRSDPLHHAWMFGTRMPTMKLENRFKKRLQEIERNRRPTFIRDGEAVIAEAQGGRTPKVLVLS